jgi:hypothetical protein
MIQLDQVDPEIIDDQATSVDPTIVQNAAWKTVPCNGKTWYVILLVIRQL